MASKYWIKLYHEILDDHKMGMLSDHLYRRVIELFLLAGEHDQNGLLPTLEAMAWRLRIDPDQLQNDLETLQDKKIVTLQDNTWVVTKFAERQSPMSDTERMKRYREAKQKENYYGDEPVTNRNKSVTDNGYDSLVDTDIDTDIDTEEDKDKELIDAFCQITGIPLPFNASTYAKWKTEASDWVRMGVTREQIEGAFRTAKEKDYTVARPQSLTNFIRGEISKGQGGGSQSIEDHNQQVIEQLAKELTYGNRNQ